MLKCLLYVQLCKYLLSFSVGIAHILSLSILTVGIVFVFFFQSLMFIQRYDCQNTTVCTATSVIVPRFYLLPPPPVARAGV